MADDFLVGRVGPASMRGLTEAMPDALSEEVLARIDGAGALYHRLILVAAPSGSGKTEALRDVAGSTGARLVNVNLELSRRMLELTERERALRLPDLLDEVVGRDEPLVLLDNIEILFDASFELRSASCKACPGTVPLSRPGTGRWRTTT